MATQCEKLVSLIIIYFGKYLSMGIQKARSDRFLCYLVTFEKWKKKKRECLSCRSRFASNRILLFFPQALIHCQVTTIKSHCYICRHYSYSSSDRIFRVAAARKTEIQPRGSLSQIPLFNIFHNNAIKRLQHKAKGHLILIMLPFELLKWLSADYHGE